VINALESYGWDFCLNPLIGYDNYYSNVSPYIGYYLEIDKLKVTAKWYDYTLPFLSGFFNKPY
jgi:hypothetical protein